MASSSPPAWKQHSGFVARPTICLAAGVLAGVAAVWATHAMGWLSVWAAVPLLAVLQYVAFTPLHEAVHGNVSGARGGRGWLDDVVGWPMAALILAPYPAFIAIHLWHHARTNDPEEDPDHWVAGPWWQVPLRCLTILWVYEWRFWLRATPIMKKHRPRAVVGLFLVYGPAIALAALGFWREVLLLWLLPGSIAIGWLAFAFDWLPHHPHTARGRYVDTRVIPGRPLELLLLGQNLHAVHHLWPRVPFYRYRAVWDASGDDMVRRGTPVTDLWGRSLADATSPRGR